MDRNETRTETVYQKIAAVMAEMSKAGIGKFRRNQQQGYNFRGIDDVYNALSPILSAQRLVVLPRVVSRNQVERQTAKGGALFYTTVIVEFDFISADDGSKHTVTTVGEAMDSGDKSSNKAQSAAMKYALLQTFTIPTEGDNDADATTHEVASRPADPLESPEAKAMLARLREAALEGEEALQAAFQKEPKGVIKNAVWKAHSASLKEAASQVTA